MIYVMSYFLFCCNAQIELMAAMYQRVTAQETDRQGVVITKALYGRLHEQDLRSE